MDEVLLYAVDLISLLLNLVEKVQKEHFSSHDLSCSTFIPLSLDDNSFRFMFRRNTLG